MTNAKNINMHGGCVVLATNGVLIRGASGSGKSSLALKLIARTRAIGDFAALVSDDQTLLCSKNSQLIARCPPSIVGQSEIRGHGIVEVSGLPSAIVHLVVELVSAENIERMPEGRTTSIAKIPLPLVYAPARAGDQALSIIFAALDDLNH